MKKKFILIVLSLILVFSLAACGEKEEKKAEKKTAEKKQESTEKKKDAAAEDMIELTIPAALFDEEGMSDINADMKAEGVKNIKVNDDGSVTYKMNKKAHEKLLSILKKEVDDTITDMLEDKESYPSYTEITYNEELTEFKIKVDSASFSAMEEFGALGLYAAGGIYQTMNQVPDDQINIKVDFLDKDSGAVLKESSSVEVGQDYQGN